MSAFAQILRCAQHQQSVPSPADALATQAFALTMLARTFDRADSLHGLALTQSAALIIGDSLRAIAAEIDRQRARIAEEA